MVVHEPSESCGIRRDRPPTTLEKIVTRRAPILWLFPLLSFISLGACVSALDVTKASCPCVEGWECCPAQDVCVPIGASCTRGSGGICRDANSGPGETCVPGYILPFDASQDLTAMYATIAATNSCLNAVAPGKLLCEYFGYRTCENSTPIATPTASVPPACAHTHSPDTQWCIVGPHIEPSPLSGDDSPEDWCAGGGWAEAAHSARSCSRGAELIQSFKERIASGDLDVEASCYAVSPVDTLEACVAHFCGGRGPHCGDGWVNAGEVCDDGTNDGSYGGCNADCLSRPPYCGDGNIDAAFGEECDDGQNGDPCDGCLDDCTARSPPPGPTVAPSVIDQDTVWYENQSPIALGQDTVVLPGATLSVCAGVRVEAASGADIALYVRGFLDVRGTQSAPVVFTSGAASPVSGGEWLGILIDGLLGGGGDVRGAIIEYADTGLGAYSTATASTIVVDCVFRNNHVGLSGNNGSDGTVVEGSSFLDNQVGANTASVYRDCLFSGNATALYTEAEVDIFDSVVTGNGVGLRGSLKTIQGCLIANNSVVGVEVDAVDGTELLFNSITANGTGVLVVRGFGLFSPAMSENTICDNTVFDLTLDTFLTVDATDNWWCTTDEAEISSRIYDVYDDASLGDVQFVPFLTAPSPDAP